MSDSDSPVKRFDPFAIREVLAEEEDYRTEEFPDEETFLKRKVIECSTCGKDVRRAIINGGKLCIHPALEIIVCPKCEEFYNDGEFSVDEDGSDKYCRWCGQGGNLYCCSSCSVAICSKCVKKNLPRKYIKEIESDDWRCFVCDPKPIWSFRALCHAAKQYVESHKPSKTSKRPRRTVDSDADSDIDSKVVKKKSKRDVSESENETVDESDDSEIDRVEKVKKKAKVSKTRIYDSDSDEFSDSTTKKRDLRSRSEKSPSSSPVKKRRGRPRKTNSDDESSNTSSARKSLRNRRTNAESNDSSASASGKRITRNKDNTKSTKNIRSPSPPKKETPKRRSQNNVSSQSPRKKEKNLLELALIDSNKDLRQYNKIVAKNQNNYEVKYLKSKKIEDTDQLQKAKTKFLGLLDDTVDSAVELRNSFLKCIESIEKKDGLVNGDKVIDKNKMNSDASNVDRAADPEDDDDIVDLNRDKTLLEDNESKDSSHFEKDENETREKDRINDTLNETGTSSQSVENIHEASTEVHSVDEQIDDSIVEEDVEMVGLPEENPDESSSCASPKDVEKSRSMADNSGEEEVFLDASNDSVNSPQKNVSVDSTPPKNGHVSEDEDLDSESKSAGDAARKNDLLDSEIKDVCSVKLPRMSEPLDLNSSQSLDGAENATFESESDISGVDALKSDAEEVKTNIGKNPKKESSFFESTRIDTDVKNVTRSAELDESLEKETEAKKSLLHSSSSSDEEQEIDLNESSVFGTKKSQPKRRISFDSDLEDNDNENKSDDQKPNESTNGCTNTTKGQIKSGFHDSSSERFADEKNKSNKQNFPDSKEWNAKKEDEAKIGLLDSTSEDESHVSDSDEDRKNELNKSSEAISNECLNSKEEDNAKKSLLDCSSDSDEIKINKSNENTTKNSSIEKGKMNKMNGEDAAKKELLNSSSSCDDDSDEYERKIENLINLNNLERKRPRPQYSSSDEREREDVTLESMKTDPKSAEKMLTESSEKKKRLLKTKTTLEEYLTENDDESSSDDMSFSKFKSQMSEKGKNFSTKEDVAKQLLLNCRSTDETDSDSDDFYFIKDEKPKKRIKKEESDKMSVDVSDIEIKDESGSDKSDNKKKKRSESDATDDSGPKKKKSRWRNDPLLRGKLLATDSSDEERMIRRARKKYDLKKEKKPQEDDSSGSEDIFVPRKTKSNLKKKKRFVLHSSNSEEEVEMRTLTSGTSSDDSQKEKKKKKKKTRKRKRIKNRMSDDSASQSETNQTPSSQKGRKNIREIMNERDLAEQTRRTAKEEEARKKRIAERQALFNKVFEVKDTSQVLEKLVLDYDTEKKRALIEVCPELLIKLKPHQTEGVKFMWNACFESLKQVEKGKGGGCILAHCMGLGKTLQVITLVHTLLRYEDTKVKTILVICPLTTVLNWRAEFEKWLQDVDDYDDYNIYELTKFKNNAVRADHLRHWNKNGGIMILGYEMFRSLVTGKNIKEKVKKQIAHALLDPGPDLVICDEGHILKNEKSAISKATMQIKSLRRIVLTGTPLQNNLIEYHCMVQFVKPNLLGNKKEFQNRFVNPITNGQYVDSTLKDVRLMKRRAHVLHRMLDGIVQRFDYNVLKPFLPPKHEFVISVGLSDLQAKLYEYYIKNKSQVAEGGGAMRLFKDYQIMRLIWTHPLAMRLSADRHQKIQDKEESDCSLKEFVVSDSDSDASASNHSIMTLSSGDETTKKAGRLTRAKKNELGIDLEVPRNSPPEVASQWWNEFVSDEDLEDYKQGPKLLLLFAIVRQCELIGDKVLIFSQSIPSLDMIEHFLTKNDEFSQRLAPDSSFCTEAEDFVGQWEKNKDYFRLDGQTPNEVRAKYCKAFNNPNNNRTRLFLISTKAGGLGINLTAANRVIIFDASWNPSYDIQSIFRVYRFGQNKPCYIYRFLSQGTMEEKIYERQVTKLSVSCRVVDEQQIDRHFSRKDITELYTFNRKGPNMDEVPKLPSDRLMAELLKQYKDVIINYHEHDSLLENIEEEELTEEERKAAWKDYEDEKNRPLSRPTVIPNTILQEVSKSISDQSIIQTIKKLHPTATPQQLGGMLGTVRQKLVDYYLSQAKSNPEGNINFVSPFSGNDVRNPVTDQQIQESLQMKQAMLLNAIQPMSSVSQPNFVPQQGTQWPNYLPQTLPSMNSAPHANFTRPNVTAQPTFVNANWSKPSASNVAGTQRPQLPSTSTKPPADPLA